MTAPVLKLVPDLADEPVDDYAWLAALRIEHAEAIETIAALRASLRVAADVAEAAESAMRAADEGRRAAVDRAEKAERLLTQVTRQLERGRRLRLPARLT
jgi:uncharacterized protein YqfA (UPF0365 family)